MVLGLTAKVDGFGNIIRAMHGTTLMTADDLAAVRSIYLCLRLFKLLGLSNEIHLAI
jgi:hypothetical protein